MPRSLQGGFDPALEFSTIRGFKMRIEHSLRDLLWVTFMDNRRMNRGSGYMYFADSARLPRADFDIRFSSHAIIGLRIFRGQ